MYGEAGSQALVKSVVTCLNHLLIVQSEQVWASKDATTCYQRLLACTLSGRAKVRKAAQQSITLAVTTASQTNPKHPVVTLAGHFCHKQLNKEANQETMYTLNMLQKILPCLPMVRGMYHLALLCRFRVSACAHAHMHSHANAGSARQRTLCTHARAHRPPGVLFWWQQRCRYASIYID